MRPLLVADTYRLAPFSLYPPGSTLSYILAYLSHLLADIPTRSGVAILYPLSNKKIGVLGLKYNSIVYNGLLIAFSTILFYILFGRALVS